MKAYQFSSRDICAEGPSLSPEFVSQILGHPKSGPVAVVNARAGAASLETERDEYARPREQRLYALLHSCLPYVQDSNQGRGDQALEKLIREELGTSSSCCGDATHGCVR